MQHVTFQGREFPVHEFKIDDRVIGAKVTYLNRTRNIAGTVSAADTTKLVGMLEMQSRCCRWDDGQDELEPRS